MISVRDGVVLKPIDLTDAADVFSVIDRERDELRTWLPFVDYTHNVKDAEDFIRSVEAAGDRGDRVFVIHFEDRFIGQIGFKGSDLVNRKSEIGYWLSKKYRGKGIMTDSVRALMKFGFETLGLNRIQIKCAASNLPSKRIPIRLGFKLEGLERDGEVLTGGVFTDLEIYSFVRRIDQI